MDSFVLLALELFKLSVSAMSVTLDQVAKDRNKTEHDSNESNDFKYSKTTTKSILYMLF